MEEGNILLVDDDTFILRMLKEYFRKWEIHAHCAETGEDALRMMHKMPFSLMVTDLQMPCMDGMELSRRAHQVAPDMPIIMCTGLRTPDICELADKIGIAIVVHKPFRLLEFLSIVKGTMKPPEPAKEAVAQPGSLDLCLVPGSG